MRTSFPVNPRGVRRSSLQPPQQPTHFGRRASSASTGGATRPSASSPHPLQHTGRPSSATARRLDLGEEEEEEERDLNAASRYTRNARADSAVVMPAASASATVEPVAKALTDTRLSPATSSGDVQGDVDVTHTPCEGGEASQLDGQEVSEAGLSSTAAVNARAPSSSSVLAVHNTGSDGDGGDVYFTAAPGVHGDACDDVDAVVERIRALTQQVELPSFDTYVIESYLLSAAPSATCTAALSSALSKRQSADAQPPRDDDSSLRHELSDLDVNRRTHRKHSAVAETREAAPLERLTSNSAAAAPAASTATGDSSAVATPLLSLKMLKGSKHALYYLHDTPNRTCTTTDRNHDEDEGVDDSTFLTAVPEEAREGNSSVDDAQCVPASATTAAETDIIDTMASLGGSAAVFSSSSSAQFSDAADAPPPQQWRSSRPLVPSQRRGGAPPLPPPRAPPRDTSSTAQLVAGQQERNALEMRSPRVGNSAHVTAAALAHARLLKKTERVLHDYKAALAVALRAVQHREAVWTALQHFLHIVRQDWDRSAQAQPYAVLSSEGGGSAPSGLTSSPSTAREELRRNGGATAAAAGVRVQMASGCGSAGTSDSSSHNADFSAQEATSFAKNADGVTAAITRPLRTTLCLSLEHLIAPPPAWPASWAPVPTVQGDGGSEKEKGQQQQQQPSSSTAFSKQPSPPLLRLPSPSAASHEHTQARSATAAAPALLRPRARSAAVASGATRRGSVLQSLTNESRRVRVPSLHTPRPRRVSSAQAGALPSVPALQPARLPQGRTLSLTTATLAAAAAVKTNEVGGSQTSEQDTPQSSARGTAAVQRSQSAPRVPPVALISPRPPTGRASAVTPRARILSDAKKPSFSGGGSGGVQARQPCTPSAPRPTNHPTQPPFVRRYSAQTPAGASCEEGETAAAVSHAKAPPSRFSAEFPIGVLSLEARLHVVPRQVYTHCLYHYLYYLQRTTLAVLEAVAALRNDHLSHASPFVVEHRNYVLEVLTQTHTLAGDAVVQWLLHKDGLAEDSPRSVHGRRSSSGKDANTDHTKAAIHPQEGAGASPDARQTTGPHHQSTRHTRSPLSQRRTSRSSSSPLQHTPLTAHRKSADSPHSARRSSSSNRTQEAELAEEQAAQRTLQVAAVQGRWPEQLLRAPLLSTHASLAPFAAIPALVVHLAAGPPGPPRGGREEEEGERNEGSGRLVSAKSTAELLRLPAEVLDVYGTDPTSTSALSRISNEERKAEQQQQQHAVCAQASGVSSEQRTRRSSGDRPTSALLAAAATMPVMPLKPLSPALQKRLQKAERILHREVAVTLSYLKLCMQCALRHEYPLYLRGLAAVHGEYYAAQPTPSSSKMWAVQTAAATHAERPTVLQKVRPARGALAERYNSVTFDDELMRADWMEELRVLWQHLMSGSSNVE